MAKINIEQLNEIGQIGQNIVAVLDDLQKKAVSTARSVEDGAASSLGSTLSKSKALVDKLSEANADTVKSLKKQKQFQNDLAALENQRTKILRKATYYGRLAEASTGKQAKKYREIQERLYNAAEYMEDIQDSSKGVLDNFDQLNKKTYFFDAMADLTNDVPILRKLFSEFSKAQKAAREEDSFFAGLRELGGAGMKAGIGFIIAGIAKGQTRVTEFSRNMMMGRQEAQALNNQFIEIGKESGFTIDQLTKFQTSTAEILGITADFNAENAKAFATMTDRLGMSVDQAMNMQLIASGTGKTIQEQNSAIVGQAMAMADASGVAVNYHAVLKDIASASTATALTTSKFSGGITKAAFEARKFGLTLAGLEQSGAGLLDFESSISAELEAELLTGKQLNLERARAAALTGDQATLAAELAANIGTAEEFSNMNVLAQEALAKSMGMSREELAKTLSRQEAINDLTKEFNGIKLEGKSLDEKVAEIQAAAQAKDGTKLDRAEALAKLGEDELARQEKNMSLQEKLANAVDKLANAMSILAKPFDFLGVVLDGIAKNAGLTVTALTALGLLKFRNIGNLLGKLKNIGKSVGVDTVKTTASQTLRRGGAGPKAGQFIGKEAVERYASRYGAKAAQKRFGKTAVTGASKLGSKSLAKIGGKLAGKTLLLKRIPVLGSLMGVGFAIDRAIKGDGAGALMELGSAGLGLVDLVAPGVGTALSLAADAGIAARDLKRAGTITPTAQKTEMPVSDFVIKPLGEDTITMAGGTKLGGNVEKLLEELISEVKKGGNVYMDGNKVGQSLMLSSTTLS